MAKVTFEYAVATFTMNVEEGDMILIRAGKVYGFLPRETVVIPKEETPMKGEKRYDGRGGRMQQAILAELSSGGTTLAGLKESLYLAKEDYGTLSNALYLLKKTGMIIHRGNVRPHVYALAS